jgi:hypothetical protein
VNEGVVAGAVKRRIGQRAGTGELFKLLQVCLKLTRSRSSISVKRIKPNKGTEVTLQTFDELPMKKRNETG